MAAPAFGFSFGDLVQAIELLHKASKALKASVGATTSYQTTVIQLNAIAKILEEVQTLRPVSARDREALDQIALLAGSCRVPLQSFQQRINKYEGYLNDAIRQRREVFGSIARVSRKVQWAVAVEEEVAKLKASIELPLKGIAFWLQWCNLDSQYDCTDKTRQDTIDLAVTVQAIKTQMTSTLTPVLPHLQAMTTQITTGNDRLLAEAAAIRGAQAQTNTAIAAQEPTLQAIVGRLDALQLSLETRVTTVPGPVLATSSSFRASTPLSPPEPRTDDMAVANTFYPSLEEILTAIRGSLTEMVFLLLFALPALHRYLRCLSTVVRNPSWLLNTDIVLEVPFGRPLKLPYEHFRYWPMIESRLKIASWWLPVQNLPEGLDIQFEYTEVQGFLLTPQTWETKVRPGMKLEMAYLLRKGRRTQLQAAGEQCRGYERIKHSESLMCSVCNLPYEGAVRAFTLRKLSLVSYFRLFGREVAFLFVQELRRRRCVESPSTRPGRLG